MAPKPTPGSTIPAGTGWVKQTAPGTFGSFPSVPAPQVSYSPSVPASWPIVVTEVDSALNSLSAQITSIAGQLNPLLPRVWFVDGGVASSGSGSIGTPFKTIGAALSMASAGDLVWIAPGTYVENLTLPNIDNPDDLWVGQELDHHQGSDRLDHPYDQVGTHDRHLHQAGHPRPHDPKTLRTARPGPVGDGPVPVSRWERDRGRTSTSFITQACILDSVTRQGVEYR